MTLKSLTKRAANATGRAALSLANWALDKLLGPPDFEPPTWSDGADGVHPPGTDGGRGASK